MSSAPVIRRLGKPGDLGWVVMAHGEVYADEFGWDRSFEALVARIVADYAAAEDPRAAAWIAELDGRRVGCVVCVPDDGDPDGRSAKLRILLVAPEARGLGLGGLLVDTCIAHARDAGYARLRLWTNHPLVAARHVYLARGFRLVAEERHRSFGVDLVGQTYELTLSPSAAGQDSRAPGTTNPAHLEPPEVHRGDGHLPTGSHDHDGTG